jgi:hypothetical protein
MGLTSAGRRICRSKCERKNRPATFEMTGGAGLPVWGSAGANAEEKVPTLKKSRVGHPRTRAGPATTQGRTQAATAGAGGDPEWLASARVPSSHSGDGFDDQRLQHLVVHISEFLDVEAAPTGLVLAELRTQRPRVAEPGHVIQNSCGLTR